MKVIFNPYYSLKNDKNRILLANSQNFKIPREKADEGVMSFIHPLYAMFFSYFDGNHTFEETINRISLDFSEDINLIRNIISPFINNQSNVGFEYEGNIFEFPKKILVNAEEYKDFKKCKYNIEDFIITEDFDFKSSRLNTSPSEIRILVNTECATDCIYCYVDRKVKNSCKIPIERIIELIKESKKIGVTSFDIAGTEIFLYKYWSTLVEYLIKNDFYPYLSTKIPIGKKIIDCLVKIGIKDIQFSIDSLIESEVEIVNKKDYSKKILNSLKFAEQSGLNVAINVVITKFNSTIIGIDTMLKKINKFSNIGIVTINIGETSAYKTEKEFSNFKVSLSQIKEIEKYYLQNMKSFNFELVLSGYTQKEDFYANYDIKKEKFEQRSLCTAGIRQMCILPDGNVTGCEELYWHPRFLMGNILEHSIEEIWNSEKAKNYNVLSRESFSKESPCKHCAKFEECRMGAGICYSDVISTYGYEQWDFPAAECPKSPNPNFVTYFE